MLQRKKVKSGCEDQVVAGGVEPMSRVPMGVPAEKVNVSGGAIAMGHPLGAPRIVN